MLKKSNCIELCCFLPYCIPILLHKWNFIFKPEISYLQGEGEDNIKGFEFNSEWRAYIIIYDRYIRTYSVFFHTIWLNNIFEILIFNETHILLLNISIKYILFFRKQFPKCNKGKNFIIQHLKICFHQLSIDGVSPSMFKKWIFVKSHSNDYYYHYGYQ